MFRVAGGTGSVDRSDSLGNVRNRVGFAKSKLKSITIHFPGYLSDNFVKY
jgi:hypothetical protein